MPRLKIALLSTYVLILSLNAGSLLQAQANGRDLAINKENRTIAITATERVLNEADVATVHIGFVLYGPDKDTAYATGAKASNAIIDALRGAGVAKDAIESDSQSLEAVDPETLKQMGADKRGAHAFVVRQSWTARVGAKDAARVLDLAVKGGANSSGEIDWSLHDPNAAQAQAATKAIQRARTQAAAMASGLGVRLGGLLYASNQVNAAPERAAPVAMMEMRARTNAAAPPPLAINPRQIETAATVYAVFALE